mgnify:CR=1 FL=1
MVFERFRQFITFSVRSVTSGWFFDVFRWFFSSKAVRRGPGRPKLILVKQKRNSKKNVRLEWSHLWLQPCNLSSNGWNGCRQADFWLITIIYSNLSNLSWFILILRRFNTPIVKTFHSLTKDFIQTFALNSKFSGNVLQLL